MPGAVRVVSRQASSLSRDLPSSAGRTGKCHDWVSITAPRRAAQGLGDRGLQGGPTPRVPSGNVGCLSVSKALEEGGEEFSRGAEAGK